MIAAVSAITITSHSSATDAPSPTAGPLSAHTIGTSTSSRFQISCLPSRRSAWSRSGLRSSGNHDMSPPAENARPDPVSTIARASRSAASSRNSSQRSWWSRSSTAFIAESG